MKIKSTQRLIMEDFPEQKDWIGRMFYVINRFLGEVILALNGGIEYGVNIMGMDMLLDFFYVSNAVTFPYKFDWTLAKPPRALSIVSATEETSTTNVVPIGALAVWTYTAEGKISITDIAVVSSSGVTTLTAKKHYRIRVRATP